MAAPGGQGPGTLGYHVVLEKLAQPLGVASTSPQQQLAIVLWTSARDDQEGFAESASGDISWEIPNLPFGGVRRVVRLPPVASQLHNDIYIDGIKAKRSLPFKKNRWNKCPTSLHQS